MYICKIYKKEDHLKKYIIVPTLLQFQVDKH